VTCMGEERKLYEVLVGKPEGNRPLERPRRRWELCWFSITDKFKTCGETDITFHLRKRIGVVEVKLHVLLTLTQGVGKWSVSQCCSCIRLENDLLLIRHGFIFEHSVVCVLYSMSKLSFIQPRGVRFNRVRPGNIFKNEK
jgi:hypothetical protein